MTKTNFDKLVRWDADYYKELTDDDCIVCLTEREVYLVGQIINMLRWKNTRWIGDIVGLDFDLIAGNLEYRLSERLTCQNVTTLLQKLNQLEDKIDYIFNETVVNEGDEGDLVTYETPASEHITPEQMAEDFSVSADTCDDAGKSEIYAGVYQLVRYIHQNNIDALQNLSQSGNLGQQAKKLISAATGGLTPLDEAVEYVSFLLDELLGEYEATVDEELLEQTTCDLFCIASANNCTISMFDVSNYYGSKLGSSALDITSSLANVVQFGLTGTFSGDEYFYYMSTFQLIATALTDHFFDIDGYDSYKLQILAGMNSPDADWMLLCDECPPMYRLLSYDFALGQNGWAINTTGISSTKGVWDGNRWKGTLTQFDEYLIQISLDTHNPAYRLRGIKFHLTRENGLSDGSRDTSAAWLRPTINSSTGQTQIQSGSFLPNGDIEECDYRTSSPFYWTGGNQVFVQQTIADNGETANLYLTKIDMLYEMNYAPERAIISYDGNICD